MIIHMYMMYHVSCIIQAIEGLNFTIGDSKGSCWGDSGGPLWVRRKVHGKYFGYLVGNYELEYNDLISSKLNMLLYRGNL